MSPILFNLVLADLEEELRKVKWGGTRIGEERVYSLLYADDMVLIAEKEEEMKSMLERLEGYIDRKGIEINVEKTKIVRFNRGRGRRKRIRWRWKGKTIEEVREYTYLGYRFQANEKQQAQVKKRVNRTAGIIRDAHETR